MDRLVTVIVNSYNRPRLIRDALDSILAQTWPNVQIIVADDWSDGPTETSLRRWAMENAISSVVFTWEEKPTPFPHEPGLLIVSPPSKPTAHERQYGQRCSVCINAAMPYAKGEFVCYLPDDDTMPANSIESRAWFLMNNPLANVVYGKLRACKSALPVAGLHREATKLCEHDDTCFWSAEPIARAANRLDHGQFMVRRVDSLPEWPETTITTDSWEHCDCDDAAFLYSMEKAGLGPFYSIPDVVVQKRYHVMHHRTDPSRRE